EFPTPQAAAALSFTQFKTFAKAHGYSRPKELPACFARLQQAQPEASPTTIAIYESEAVALAAVLLNLVQTQFTVARAGHAVQVASRLPHLPFVAGGRRLLGSGAPSEIRQRSRAL